MEPHHKKPQGNLMDDLSKCFGKAARHIRNAIPSSVKETHKDIEKTFHVMLQNALAKLKLVPREEFDAQAGVLEKTRHKLQTLEKRVAELEEGKHSAKKSKDIK
jgi:ubiquinone biosynthesis accessory factor UbiK